MRVVNLTRGNLIATRAELAAGFWRRLRGWMGKARAYPGEALVIHPCRAVHTCWMFFPIDILFISQSGIIVYIIEGLPPFRFTRVVRDACLVIELPAGTVRECGVEVGDTVGMEGLTGVPRNIDITTSRGKIVDSSHI